MDDATPSEDGRRPAMNGFDWKEQRSVPAESIAGKGYVDHVRKFARDMNLAYPVGVAASAVNNEAYGVRSLPTLVVIDPKGEVAWIRNSPGPGTHRLLETLLRRMLDRE